MVKPGAAASVRYSQRAMAMTGAGDGSAANQPNRPGAPSCELGR